LKNLLLCEQSVNVLSETYFTFFLAKPAMQTSVLLRVCFTNRLSMKLFEKRHTDSLKNPRFEQKTLLRTIPKSGESFYYREISQSLTILVDICLLMNC